MIRRMFRTRLIILTIFGLWALVAAPGQVTIGPLVNVKSYGSRWYPDYQIQADPTDPKYLIICGGKWDTAKNELSGFVYTSTDGGRNWTESLEDRSSTFVSEHSCAMGADGKAYFVSSASKVIDGVLHHNLGTTRIFTSDDHGQTWTKAVKTGFVDSPLSVLRAGNKPGGSRLFTFFNQMDWKNSKLTRMSLFAFRAGERRVSRVVPNWTPDDYRYRGSFPHKVIIFNDGSIAALYRATLDTSNPVELAIGIALLNPGRRLPVERATAVHVVVIPEQSCFIDDTSAYDSLRDRIWVAYHEYADGRCKFLLRASNDHGRTWSKPHEVGAPATASREYHNPAMEFNAKGVLGFLWRDTERSNCWYFAASHNEGITFTSPEPLSSACSATSADHRSNEFLMTQVTQDTIPRDAGPTISVINHLNGVWQFGSPLIATSDDLFHAVWIDGKTRQGELRTAAINVDGAHSSVVSEVLPSLSDLVDVDDEVALLYGGEQHYDPEKGSLTLSVVLRNMSTKPIYGPIVVQAISVSSDVGPVRVVNFDNRECGPGALWTLSGSLQKSVLQPSGLTRPFSFSFRFSPEAATAQETPFDIVRMRLRVLAKSNRTKEK